MALVSGGRSTLNPNAPLFIPAVFRQVEDFSPEWWELVKTSTWFRGYWADQHEREEKFDGYDEEDDTADILNFLPESIDLGIDDDDFPNLEAQVEELVQYPGSDEAIGSASLAFQKGKPQPGLKMDIESLIRNQSLSKSPRERAHQSPMASPKYLEKPVKSMSPKCSPRRINQPR